MMVVKRMFGIIRSNDQYQDRYHIFVLPSYSYSKSIHGYSAIIVTILPLPRAVPHRDMIRHIDLPDLAFLTLP